MRVFSRLAPALLREPFPQPMEWLGWRSLRPVNLQRHIDNQHAP